MDNLRKYGQAPYKIAVVHGGPGAPGEIAPVARELSIKWGVLEPLQTADTVAGQVDELKSVLENHSLLPVTLVGHSWGAWLVYMLAALHTSLVGKIILIGSGPFEDAYVKTILEKRLNRLSKKDEAKAIFLLENLNATSNNNYLDEFGQLMSKADSFDPLPDDCEAIYSEDQQHIYQSVWLQAEKLRSDGELLSMGAKITCQVVAIHGDYDSHPYEGVQKPLTSVVKDFKLILLENCGHKPWIERQAKDQFYNVIKKEIEGTVNMS